MFGVDVAGVSFQETNAEFQSQPNSRREQQKTLGQSGVLMQPECTLAKSVTSGSRCRLTAQRLSDFGQLP